MLERLVRRHREQLGVTPRSVHSIVPPLLDFSHRALSWPMETSETSDTARELLCGGFAGAVGVFVGQPFDFVKVRLQAGSTLGGASYSGALDCVVTTVRREGVLGMYRGATPPLLNSFVLNAIMFAGYGHGSRVLQGHGLTDASRTFLAGSYAGALQVVALVPVDAVKCRMQIDRATHGSAGLYSGPLDCVRQIVRSEGPRGLYRGSLLTLLRDSPTMGLYFLLYEACERELPRLAGTGEAATTLWAGGICGTITWALAYPFDTLKTRAQTMPAAAPDAERTVGAIWRQIVAEAGGVQRGVALLYRGLATCLLRAFPVNAVTFLVYKRSMAHTRAPASSERAA